MKNKLNNKHFIFPGVLVLAVVVFALTVSVIPNTQLVNLSAKLQTIESLDKMESKSKLIIKGTKTEVIDQIQHQDPQTKEVVDQYSISNIEVIEIFKDETRQDFKQGDNIIVRENSWIEDGVTYQVEGYQLMEDNNEYLLFLGENNKGDYFYPRGVIYGKVEVNKPFIGLDFNSAGSSNPAVNDIHNQALSKYIR